MNMQVTDWAAHYKAVRNRIAGVKTPPPPEPKPQSKGRTLYSAPIGPVIVRDWIDVRTPDKPPFRKILDEVLAKHGVSYPQFAGRSRVARYVQARREVWFRASRETELSLKQIGRLSGGRDHSTVIYGIYRYEAEHGSQEHHRITKNRLSSRQRYLATRDVAIAAE